MIITSYAPTCQRQLKSSLWDLQYFFLPFERTCDGLPENSRKLCVNDLTVDS